MKLINLIILLLLSSCEELIYGKYQIIEKNLKRTQPETKYVVKKGENLFIISEKFNISLKSLIKVNNVRSPYKIFPGQKLLIPRKMIHVIKKGDTLYSISREYGVDRSSLFKINGIKPNQKIYVGDSIVIPIKEKKKYQQRKKKELQTRTNPSKKIIDTKLSFIWPIRGEVILGFGKIKSGFHNDGINIKSDENSPVIASETGEIIYTGNEIPGYGNLILIKHKNNWVTAYSHLKQIIYKKGQVVRKGQKIGKIGKTGNVDEPQLHFEIRKGKKAINPTKFLS